MASSKTHGGRRPSIGVVGLGVMGSGMAVSLLRNGFKVYGFDIDPARATRLDADGLRPVSSAREVAEFADVVLVSVMTGAQVLEAIEGPRGLLAARRTRLLVLNTSTIALKSSARARAVLGATEASLLCATVSGSAAAAADGALSLFCSGDRNDFERVSNVLEAIGKQSAYVGEGDVAQSIKLIVNLVVIGTMALIGESVALGEALGVDAGTTFEQLNASAVASPFIAVKAPAVVARDYKPTASVQLVRKDLSLIRELAAAAGQKLTLTELVDAMFERAEDMGFSDRDFAAVAEVFRDESRQQGGGS